MTMLEEDHEKANPQFYKIDKPATKIPHPQNPEIQDEDGIKGAGEVDSPTRYYQMPKG
jgi:hypothetical protein